VPRWIARRTNGDAWHATSPNGSARRRRLGRGEGHTAVEQLLLGLTTSKQRAALALYDDQNRAADVYNGLNHFGRWAGDAFRAVNEGAHGRYEGDLPSLIRDAQELAKKLRELP
jgi:hypothetical protein